VSRSFGEAGKGTKTSETIQVRKRKKKLWIVLADRPVLEDVETCGKRPPPGNAAEQL